MLKKYKKLDHIIKPVIIFRLYLSEVILLNSINSANNTLIRLTTKIVSIKPLILVYATADSKVQAVPTIRQLLGIRA